MAADKTLDLDLAAITDQSASLAASRTAIEPVPLSVAPVPRSQESRCPPTITISSGLSVPRISPTVLYTSTGFPLNLPLIFSSTCTGPCSSKRAHSR